MLSIRLALVLLLAPLAQYVTREVWASERDPRANLDAALALEQFQAELSSLRTKREALEKHLDQLSKEQVLASSGGTPNAELDDEIARALERWLAENPSTLAAHARDASDLQDEDVTGIASLPIEEIFKLVKLGDIDDENAEALFKALRDSGRMEEYFDALQAMIDKDPSDPDLRTALGVAYLQRLFITPPGPDSGLLAMRADEAFDQALALDENHWSARFTKAVSLSNWPAFLGKGGEAIQQLEILLTQQENLPASPEHAQTYLFLGNMYQQQGQNEKALETWRQGFSLFPESMELAEQLTLQEDSH